MGLPEDPSNYSKLKNRSWPKSRSSQDEEKSKPKKQPKKVPRKKGRKQKTTSAKKKKPPAKEENKVDTAREAVKTSKKRKRDI